VRSGATLTLTSEYANDPAASSPWLFGGAIDVPIEHGARRTARIGATELGVSLARYDYAEAAWAGRMAIRRAMADYMIASRQLETGQALVALRSRQLAALENRLRVGAISRALVDPVRIDATSATRSAADADARIHKAMQDIAGVIGLPAHVLDGRQLYWAGFDSPSTDPASSITPDMRRSAVLARSDVLKSIVSYDQSEADLHAEVARQYPAISIAPGYTWERGLVKLPLSIGLTLPPVDLNRSAIAAAFAKRTEAGQQIEQVIAKADSAVDAALLEGRAAREALIHIRQTDIPTARHIADQAEAQLHHGSIDRTEWAVAQAGVYLTRLTELDALARVHAADAALEDALHRPLEGPELMMTNNVSGMQP
jgi:CRISPR system Cascade subunit CasA